MPKASDQDFYSYRLAEVDKCNAVVASEDINNQQGAKLVAKGERISRNKAEVIIKHRLAKPLEHCVDVENCLDAEGLFKLFNKFIDTQPSLAPVAKTQEHQSALKRLCSRYEKFPLIRQKLTVLSNQLPEIYYHSLFGAIAGVAICKELTLPENEEEIVFFAALMHNSGYLHLDPNSFTDALELEDPHNPGIQIHAKISALFLQSVKGLPKRVAETVENHHERTDGTGFPQNKFGKELDVPSQIIAMTDLLVRSYFALEVYQEHAHQLALLIVQLNDNVHFENIYKATARLIQKGPMPNTPPMINIPPEEVLEQYNRIMELFDAEKKLALVLMKNINSKIIRSIAAMLGRISTSIIRSGLAQEQYATWLKEQIESPNIGERLTLLKSLIIQNEIEDQLCRLRSLQGKAVGIIPSENIPLKEMAENTIKRINQL